MIYKFFHLTLMHESEFFSTYQVRNVPLTYFFSESYHIIFLNFVHTLRYHVLKAIILYQKVYNAA